jgi:serine/threonine protein phosphatase 1
MRTLVIGDIHGGYALHQIMERAKVTKEDTLIFLRLRRWLSQSAGSRLLNWIEYDKQLRLYSWQPWLLLHWLRDSKDNLMWYKHGGEATVLAYEKVNSVTKQLHVDFTFVKRLLSRRKEPPLFTRIYQHEWRYLWIFPKLFYWDRTLWETALSLDQRIKPNDLLYPKRLIVWRNLYRPYPVTRIENRTCTKSLYLEYRYRSGF